jgi:tetratricopeptide (TPR) repeat protein
LHTSLGQAYLHAQKLEEAETEFHLELQTDSGSELAWLGLANLELAEGQATAAVESLRKVWETSPEFLAVQRGFPSIELSPASAKDSIARLVGEPEGPARHFLLAALYASTNESALSDREWKSFQAGFLAWQRDRAVQQEPRQIRILAKCIATLPAQIRCKPESI